MIAQLYNDDSTNKMGGIVVLHVFQDSEAQKAGVWAGDIILEIDGKKTSGRVSEDIVLDNLRGKVGLSSNVKIKRVQEDKTISIRIKRALVTYKPNPAD